MAKLKNRHTARLIDVWVPGNSGNNPGNYHWIKKLVILILLLVILIFLTSLWNYYDVSFKEKTPSSLVNESLITAPIIGKPGKVIWSVRAGNTPLLVTPLLDGETVYVVTGNRPETGKIFALDFRYFINYMYTII